MADIYPVAGAKFYIGPVTATKKTDFVAADFTGMTEGDWDEVDGWENAGAYGDSAQVITSQLINRNRDTKQKGTRNAGQMTNQFVDMPTDAGQLAMAQAEKDNQNYAFRIVYDDPAATTHYFVGLLMSWSNSLGGANDRRLRDANIEINSNIVEA